MSAGPSIIATLGLQRGQFKSEAERTKEDLAAMSTRARETAAAIALLERQMKGGGSGDQRKQLSQLKTDLRDATQEMKLLEAQKRRLDTYLGDGETRSKGTATGQARPTTPDAKQDGGAAAKNAHNGGMNRSQTMEAGHSVRAIFDMTGAGQNLANALQIELPKLMQAAAMSFGKMLGIEAGMSLFKGVNEAIVRSREERIKNAEVLGGDGVGGTRYTDLGGLSRRAEELGNRRDEILGNSGPNETGKNENLYDLVTRGVRNLYRGVTGSHSVEEEKDENTTQMEAQRIRMSEELAHRKKEAVELDMRAHHEGQLELAADREKLRLKEEIAKVVDSKGLDAHAQSEIIDHLKAESKLRQEINELALEKKNIERQETRNSLTIKHPGVDGGDGEDRLLQIDPTNPTLTRAVRQALNERDARVADEESIKAHGGDTRDAHNRTLGAESGLRDVLVEEAMKTPEERAKDAQTERQRRRVEARMENMTRRHQEAYEANDTKGAFNRRFHPQAAPEPGTPEQVQPDMRAKATVDPQQSPAAPGGFNDANIVGKLDGVISAIKEIPLKNQ